MLIPQTKPTSPDSLFDAPELFDPMQKDTDLVFDVFDDLSLI
jgi:hypothetical protein